LLKNCNWVTCKFDRVFQYSLPCSWAVATVFDNPQLKKRLSDKALLTLIEWRELLINWEISTGVDQTRQVEWLLKLSVVLTVSWKVSEEDIAGLQAYTIYKMDEYMPTGKDIDY